MRRLRRIGLVLLVLAVVVVAWEPSRVGLQTAVLLPNLLDAGPKPLNLVTEAPQRTSVTYRVAAPGADPDLAELWLPSWASAESPAGAMLLVFGVNNLGRNHPIIERVADGLARTGVAVLVPIRARCWKRASRSTRSTGWCRPSRFWRPGPRSTARGWGSWVSVSAARSRCSPLAIRG